MISSTLVFVHGGPGLPEYLRRFFEPAFEGQVATVFYEQNQTGDATIDAAVSELDRKVRAISGPVVLVGHSWGGILATEYAARNQGRVAGLVLIASAYSAAYRGQGNVLLQKRNPEHEQLDVYLTAEEKAEWREPIDLILKQFNESFYNGLLADYLGHFDRADFLRTTDLPVLNIFGDQDYCIVSHHQRELGRLNPQFQNLQLLGAGHFPFLLERHRLRVTAAVHDFAQKS